MHIPNSRIPNSIKLREKINNCGITLGVFDISFFKKAIYYMISFVILSKKQNYKMENITVITRVEVGEKIDSKEVGQENLEVD